MTQEELKAIRDRFIHVMLADEMGTDAQIDAWMALLGLPREGGQDRPGSRVLRSHAGYLASRKPAPVIHFELTPFAQMS